MHYSKKISGTVRVTGIGEKLRKFCDELSRIYGIGKSHTKETGCKRQIPIPYLVDNCD